MTRVVAGDFARPAANFAGANFQVAVTTAAGAAIQGIVDEGPRSLVVFRDGEPQPW